MLAVHKLALAACIFAAPLTGCASVNEKHYFATVATNAEGGTPRIVNIFRLDVSAGGGLANIRYVAGTYDERAIDFFLNEVKAEDYVPSDGRKGPDRIFKLACPEKDADGKVNDKCKDIYDKTLKLVPLNGGENSDLNSFMIILSTNANAIAETVGAIAENTIALQSINYLINKDTFEEASLIEATKTQKSARRKATIDSLTTSFDDAYAANAANNPAAELAILQALANELVPEGATAFQTIEEAKAWFGTVK